MKARQIYCAGCGKHMGEIRDAKLRKGIVYLCGTCETKRLASDLAVKTKPRDPGEGFWDTIFDRSVSCPYCHALDTGGDTCEQCGRAL